MKALVYKNIGQVALEEKAKPGLIASTDAIVKIIKTTICGTDLHIIKGDVKEVVYGLTLGHEGIGIIEETGDNVSNFKKGDHVLISCITSCGKCDYCRKGMYSHCHEGGWILGHLIDGTQAEYVRIPYADTSLYHIPTGTNEESLVMLSDIFPTGYECGVLNGQVQPGTTVAIVGAGPIGLAALTTARFFSPADIIVIDTDSNRLEVAKQMGATHAINSQQENVVAAVMALTGYEGVDTAMEAVGIPATFELCTQLIRPGGKVANIGVHGKPVSLAMQDLWSKNITITTRLVDTCSTPMLLKTVSSKKLDPASLITHHFKLSEIVAAYETFGNAAKEKALKVIISNEY
ncbi:zinc-dependent alcohol dehydrogenase family protein [Chitinophaga sp.]|uniref:zinc-dependent alcohol dehydrogenase family protein n=1 Tax=Chitinophaga sp. TaxID=1869181 RepID=UPI0031E40E36